MTHNFKRFFYLFIIVVSWSRSNCQEIKQNDDKTASTRIIGGTAAFLGEYPAMISLQRRTRAHFCGGTLLDDRHVLTAAHCVTDTATGAVNSPSSYYIVGNTLQISPLNNPSNQTRDATHVFVHIGYNTRSLVNDIAIIRVSPPFTFTNYFYPATPIASPPPANYSCSVAGWGIIKNGTQISSDILMRVNITTVSNAQCNAAYGSGIGSGMICAADVGKDSCQGDSGGGLYCGNFITGIVSFGVECAHPYYPGVYTNVAAYTNWINNQLVWNGGSHSQIPTPPTQRPNNNNSSAVSIIISIYIIMSSAFFILVLR